MKTSDKMKKIKIDFDYAETEVELKDMELLSLPGRKNKGEKGGSLCVKDGMNFEIATINTGDLESSNALCNEIVRRFNECPNYIKENKNITSPIIDNYIAQHYRRNGKHVVNLIRKDLNVIITMEIDNFTCYVMDINVYAHLRENEDNISGLVIMIAYYASCVERMLKLLIPRFPVFNCHGFNVLESSSTGIKHEQKYTIYEMDLIANRKIIQKKYEHIELSSRM